MKKQRKTLRTPYEVMKSIRKPAAPPSRSHGDERKERDRNRCRDTSRRNDDES
jgi:hypothetical protein